MDFGALVSVHFKELKNKYPELSLAIDGTGQWVIKGRLNSSAQYNGISIDDEYDVEISIPPNYPFVPPSVREVGDRIPKDYHHSDLDLCLATPGELIQKFKENPTLLGFIENLLIPYLYRFSFISTYHKEPFGDRSHGWLGIYEYYQELFQIKDKKAVIGLLKVLADNQVNGHMKCPCRSKKRLRRCHGDILRMALSQIPNQTVLDDLNQIVDGFLKVSQAKRNNQIVFQKALVKN